MRDENGMSDAEQKAASRRFAVRFVIVIAIGVAFYAVVRGQDAVEASLDHGLRRSWTIWLGSNEAYPPVLDSSQVVAVVTTLLVYCGAAAIAVVQLQYGKAEVEPNHIAVMVVDRLEMSALLAAALCVAVALSHSLAGESEVPRSHRYIVACVALLTTYVAAAISQVETRREINERLSRAHSREEAVAAVLAATRGLRLYASPARIPFLRWLVVALLSTSLAAGWSVVMRGDLRPWPMLLGLIGAMLLSAASDILLATVVLAGALKDRFMVVALITLMCLSVGVLVALVILAFLTKPALAGVGVASLVALLLRPISRLVRRGPTAITLSELAEREAVRLGRQLAIVSGQLEERLQSSSAGLKEAERQARRPSADVWRGVRLEINFGRPAARQRKRRPSSRR